MSVALASANRIDQFSVSSWDPLCGFVGAGEFPDCIPVFIHLEDGLLLWIVRSSEIIPGDYPLEDPLPNQKKLAGVEFLRVGQLLHKGSSNFVLR